MGENDVGTQSQAGRLFENFVQASTCKGTLQAFNILTRQLELDPLDYRNFYTKLKTKVNTWKAKALWNKLDKKTSHKEYKKGKAAINTKCLIIGGGPCGLRTAIELASLGAKAVVVEKRDTFSRNNVLHLWPFTIHDLRSLGAKKFYGKFCAGSIDHISIRQLQLILFKVALLLGVEIHVNLEFVKVLEPPEDQENQKIGWRAEFLPVDHPLSEYEFDVIIGADGRRNTLEGFRRKEFRGKLAIAITANFINRNTTAEAKVEEISGVAFIFNQKFFQDLKEETGIDLENIVYYKDSTHYFVMTAKKQSLLDKGVIIYDYIDTEMLLSAENVNQENLLSYAREAADFATNYQLPTLDYAINHYGQPDVAMFDFTSMYASENAALIRERQGHHLLVALVGDSLLEPFWPMGTGCARGFLAVFDTVWMVKGWAQAAPHLELIAERESLYRLLPQTTPENINKNFDQYTIDPGTRYPNLNSSCVRPHQVRHLFLTSELQQFPVERVSSIRRSVNLSRHESDVRPNKLLTWCQKQTEGYKSVTVTDLATSWKSGLALCAIIHRFRPDLIDFDSLNEEDAIRNNQLAFDIAEKEFGIPPITTGKEMASASEPDKLSMVMYLSKFYELFRGTPLRVVDNACRRTGENGADYPLKTSNGIYNNHINLTLPRKRVPKVERKAEENEPNKRRRKGPYGDEEPMGFSSQSASSGSEYGDCREGTGQNKVKSMATQLLAKFEDNAPTGSLRRQFQAVGRAPFVALEPKQPAARVTRESRIPPKRDDSRKSPPILEKAAVQPTLLDSEEVFSSVCPAALAIAGILDRLQHLEEKINQKRAQSLANREFHKKSIKDKAAHLASLFGCDDVPQNKLPASHLSHCQLKPSYYPSLPSSPKSSASPSSSSHASEPNCASLPSGKSVPIDDSDLSTPKVATKNSPFVPDPEQMTVGKVSRGVGAMAQVLINLYLNDHRPKAHSSSPERVLDGAAILSDSSASPCTSPLHSGKGSLRKEFPANIGGSDICYFCKKRVYVMERQSAEGHFFHRECFRCNFCSTTLRLGVYAFDVDEGKFYCKPHFIYCKTNNKQRKRRVELNARTFDDPQEWTSEEAPKSESVAASAFTTVSSAVDSAPGILVQSLDEATSPKKFRNVSQSNENMCSSVSSEWASVKIIPEEEMTDHNLLAVRVMVTTDGSSSEMESDVCGYISNSESNENWDNPPEQKLTRSPIRRHFSVDQSKKMQDDGSIASKAIDALHRAGSFQASPSNIQQNWRKIIRSTFPMLIGKKTELKEKSSLTPNLCDHQDLSHNEISVTASTRGPLSACTPAFEGMSNESQQDFPAYVPHHHAMTNNTKEPEFHLHGNVQPDRGLAEIFYNKEDDDKTKKQISGRTMDPHLQVRQQKDNTDLRQHSMALEQDINENHHLKKLVLSDEERAGLLDWNIKNTQRTSSQYRRSPSLDMSVPTPFKRNSTRRESRLQLPQFSKPSPAAQNSSSPSLADSKHELNVSNANPAEENSQSRPKSPFQIIANAIKRSLNSSESNKNTSTHKPQPGSPSNIFDFPKPTSQFGGLRRSQSNIEKVTRPQILRKASDFSFKNAPTYFKTDEKTTLSEERPSEKHSPPHNLYTRHVGSSSVLTHDKSCNNKMEDPMLERLERINIKDNSPKDLGGEIFLRNRKNSLFSSLRFSRDKSSDIITDGPNSKSDIWSIFGTLRKKVNESDVNGSIKRTTTPFSAFFTETVLNNPSTTQETGSKHLSARAFVNGDFTSSSDDEREEKTLSSLKMKRLSKRRRKLEREAKQKIKQEELKRLHKAQSIQRQLQEIEERQSAIEIQGVELEKALRGESGSCAQDEAQLLQEWFKLVMEKNKLDRYESELLIIAQGLELEDHQSRLEQKLREKMDVDESQRDEKDLQEEQETLCEMMRVIEKRDKLVSFLEQQRLREKAEDQSIENFMSSRGYHLNVDLKNGAF
ncbi:F-actin-monooxygenase MICAL2 isoform X2 [Pleurodeles waltl]|uniref:F-actin-monooxygenase MICAL2 isoform X2 n=1 Tax=Pleurodeles waltl TaxID=8319 RepID=UPI00370959E4